MLNNQQTTPISVASPSSKTGRLSLSVGQRIALLIVFSLFLLMLTGSLAFYALNQNKQSQKDINARATMIAESNYILKAMYKDHTLLLYDVLHGVLTWEAGRKKLAQASKTFERASANYKVLNASSIVEKDPEVLKVIQALQVNVSTLKAAQKLLQTEDRGTLELYVTNDLYADIQPLESALATRLERDVSLADQEFSVSLEETERSIRTAVVIVLLGLLMLGGLGFLVFRSIAIPVNKLIDTTRKISAGDFHARAQLLGNDQLSQLGKTFDQMLDERMAIQQQTDQENKQLNDSVFMLLEAVADLNERNLTARAQVPEDATGPLADAINQLAMDTTEVLKKVRDVATSVETASLDVNRYALSVNELAKMEQTEGEATASQLGVILQRLDSIADAAQQANQIAETTSDSTLNAQKMVSRTQGNMVSIRETVQQTGKQLKRLGERSQEITQVVDVINSLSERTTILALNASMQAAAAGEAGQGFSMIAEEIQQLSESSREFTEQIALLVNNIQHDANTTMATMEQTIEKVVEGSALTEETAQQMQANLEATNALIAAVEDIATSSAEQVVINKTLQARTKQMLETTQTRSQELHSLTDLTTQMAVYGQQLVESVNVFKLEEKQST
jgi:methyl-accepting chemotaxis protein